MTRPRTALVFLAGLTALALPSLAGPAAAAEPAATSTRSSVTMYSDPGDYIGGGQAQLFDSNNAKVTASGGRNTVTVAVSGGTSGTDFTFDIAAPDSSPLKVGEYDRAQRASFRSAGRPGLDISGDGRGCNEVAGSFEVRDIAFSPAGKILRLHLLYEQHCEGGPAALFGEVRFQEPSAPGLTAESSSVTWPATYSGASSTVVPVTLRALGRDERIASVRLVGGDADAFLVRSDECTGVLVPRAGSCQVLLRFAPQAGGPRSSSLVVTDRAGRATTVQLDGSATTGTTALTLDGDQGDYVTGGRSFSFTPATAQLSITGSRQHIAASAENGTDDFDVDLAPAAGDVIAPGTYSGATRYPFNGSAPGLSVTGDGAGCNTVSGSFTVEQAVFSPVDDSLQHLRATFVQHCEGANPALHGELTFQAAADVVAPAKVKGLAASAGPSSVRLTWTDPTRDWQRTIVRAFAGQTAPMSPTAGISVPASAGQAVAGGLVPGAAYAFAVFTVDPTGNVGPPAVVRATAGAASATLEP